ncbi:hypothetical protein FIBSPDRAFT_900327 [Athelia psychrophila]|uniref:Uncharacterized protein n=1 Tax=Athelia psychrophila TaxID=1759441 RepID=A0A165YKC6_9AGAM|nr:hypothetical protein FIBSPDRAFT_900327 [Fibularhizoctonia sp. CBS 109695]
MFQVPTAVVTAGLLGCRGDAEECRERDLTGRDSDRFLSVYSPVHVRDQSLYGDLYMPLDSPHPQVLYLPSTKCLCCNRIKWDCYWVQIGVWGMHYIYNYWEYPEPCGKGGLVPATLVMAHSP